MWKSGGRAHYQRCGIRGDKAEREYRRHDGGQLRTLSSFRGRRRPSSCEAQTSADIATKQVAVGK